MHITFRQWPKHIGYEFVPKSEKKTIDGNTPIADEGYTLKAPPEETRRKAQPCKWVVDEWVLVTSGDVFDEWRSETAKRELAEEDCSGELERTVEELVDYVVNGTPLSQFAIDKVAARKAKRAKIK